MKNQETDVEHGFERAKLTRTYVFTVFTFIIFITHRYMSEVVSSRRVSNRRFSRGDSPCDFLMALQPGGWNPDQSSCH